MPHATSNDPACLDWAPADLNKILKKIKCPLPFSYRALNQGLLFFLFLKKCLRYSLHMGFPGGSDGKESACNAGDLGLIPRSGRSPGEGNGNPLQYSCLENAMDRGAWWVTVYGVTKSQIRLSDFHLLTHTYNLASYLQLQVLGLFKKSFGGCFKNVDFF